MPLLCPQWRTAHRAWDDSPLLSRSVASVFADSVFLDSINHAQKEVFVEKLYLYRVSIHFFLSLFPKQYQILICVGFIL